MRYLIIAAFFLCLCLPVSGQRKTAKSGKSKSKPSATRLSYRASQSSVEALQALRTIQAYLDIQGNFNGYLPLLVKSRVNVLAAFEQLPDSALKTALSRAQVAYEDMAILWAAYIDFQSTDRDVIARRGALQAIADSHGNTKVYQQLVADQTEYLVYEEDSEVESVVKRWNLPTQQRTHSQREVPTLSRSTIFSLGVVAGRNIEAVAALLATDK